ncbi:endonuclease domain-containing 1 protein isoform X2 [Oreochromis niloticus]|uniref:endonuclease domain-containing 1 protein isoform X2 n=1 Tax=Oreochromis niloticus TaxID=8128 RepID=UPI000DF24FC5|nr:endonuclease domain-containing 1 protein isoform X2 [Oreochromis niloticus]
MKQGEAMSLLKQLLPLAALLLLSIVPTDSRVVTSVEDCNEFFLQQIPPNIPGILEGGNTLDQNRYKVICQTLRNIRRFVTLYDTKNRIPVFSAAEYRGGPAGKRPKIKWMIEPQVSIQSRPGLIACCSEEVFTSLFHLCRQLSLRESSSSCFT